MENTAINNALPPQDGREYILTDYGWELSEDERNKEKWYTVREACKETKMSDNAILRAIKGGRLAASTISDSSRHGFHYLIRESDLISWFSNPEHHRRGAKKGTKYKPRKTSKPELAIDETNRPGYNDDIRKLAEYFEGIIVKHEIASYEKGFADGKLSVQHDDEDAYRRGLEEGKKQAKADLLTLIKEVG